MASGGVKRGGVSVVEPEQRGGVKSGCDEVVQSSCEE